MKIVKILTPLEAAAKSLFKDTIGNDLGKTKHCQYANIYDCDMFVKSAKAKVTSKNRRKW
ncbi:hypothetical protein IJ674_05900 [bacterium]|nr:hypothetical protein [bacterium]